MKLKTGDTVKIIAGKDKGTESKIARVIPDKNRVIIEGVATACLLYTSDAADDAMNV